MSAVKTIQQMQSIGVCWSFEGGAMKLQSDASVPPSLVRSINQNRKEIMRLIRTEPTAQQIEMLAELEALNAKWDTETLKEAEGFPNECELDVLARLIPMVDRANELYQSLTEQNPLMVQGMRCLFHE